MKSRYASNMTRNYVILMEFDRSTPILGKNITVIRVELHMTMQLNIKLIAEADVEIAAGLSFYSY
jgi:hypothetical protein